MVGLNKLLLHFTELPLLLVDEVEDKPHLFLSKKDFIFIILELLKDDVVLFKEFSELRELVQFLVDDLLNLPGYGQESFCCLC